MMTFRHAVASVTTVLLAAGLASPAAAQSDPRAVVNDIVACSAISTVDARVACYDAVAASARGPDAAPRGQIHQQVPAATASAPTPREQFGRESMARREDRPQPQGLPEIAATVTATRQVRPGYYFLALNDGSEWEFAEAVPASYFPPRLGTTVTVQRAALGSFQMVVPGRAPVRVRRVR